jgi:hypothetical protein
MKIKIISLGRASYRKVTLTPFIETNPKLIIFDDYFFSLLRCFWFSFFYNKNIIEVIFCDNFENTLNFKIINFFFTKKKISFLWFNGITEINKGSSFKNINYNFFPEQQKFINKKINTIIPIPKKINIKKNNNTFLLSYISEVIINIEDSSYKKINEQNAKVKKKIENFVWTELNKNRFEKISNFDFSYNFVSKLIYNDSNYNKLILSNEVYKLFKHRMRYVAVSRLNKNLKDRMCLIGETWDKLGFKTFRNNYDYYNNREIYANSTFSLDCGSTSGEYPIYLRLYEIIINSSCLFQSKTSFSNKIFGKLSKTICFSDLDEMIYKINLLKNFDDKKLSKLKKEILVKIKAQNFKSI